MSRRKIGLVATTLIVAIGIGYLLLPKRSSEMTDVAEVTAPESVQTSPEVVAENVETAPTAVAVPRTCLPAGITISMTKPLPEEEFYSLLSGFGEPTEKEMHWTNHAIERDGKSLVLHLVPSEGGQGQQTWLLKTFNDLEDGPVLLSEKTFLKKSEASKALQLELQDVPLRHRTDVKTFRYKNDVSVKHDVEDGRVISFVIYSPAGRYSCEGGGCGCL